VLVCFHGGTLNNGSVNSPHYDGKRLCGHGDAVVTAVSRGHNEGKPSRNPLH
jgi:carboxylesterase type B